MSAGNPRGQKADLRQVSTDRFPVEFLSRPGLELRLEQVSVDSQIIFFRRARDILEKRVAAIHRRRGTEHDPGASAAATEIGEYRQHFFLPGFRRASCKSAL